MSINTIRLVTIKDPTTKEPKPFAAVLRLGVNGNVVDNWAMGGLIVEINDDATLAEHAFYKPGKGTKTTIDVYKRQAYNFGDEEVVPSAQRKILKSLTEKKILGAYIVMSARGMKLAFPVDFEMNDDLTWEVTSDNETMGVFGELKGKFRVGQNGTDVYVNGDVYKRQILMQPYPVQTI